jgi:hypothetical protein
MRNPAKALWFSLFEFDVKLESEKAFDNLKGLLVQKGCRVVTEEHPTSISVKQGSIWGISPKTAKKTIECRLSPADSKTHITVSSSLSSDWKNLTAIGSILSVIVAAFCLWISFDLEGFVTTQQPTWWSWIATSGDFVNFGFAEALASLAWWLAVFLTVVVFVEIIIYVYAKLKIDAFAEETLKNIS